MHSLDTLRRLNNEQAERELSRAYGRAVLDSEAPLGPGRPFGLAVVLRRLRSALVAVTASLLYGCAHERAPVTPDIAGPCPPPPALVLRPVAVAVDAGEVVAVEYGGPAWTR